MTKEKIGQEEKRVYLVTLFYDAVMLYSRVPERIAKEQSAVLKEDYSAGSDAFIFESFKEAAAKAAELMKADSNRFLGRAQFTDTATSEIVKDEQQRKLLSDLVDLVLDSTFVDLPRSVGGGENYAIERDQLGCKDIEALYSQLSARIAQYGKEALRPKTADEQAAEEADKRATSDGKNLED